MGGVFVFPEQKKGFFDGKDPVRRMMISPKREIILPEKSRKLVFLGENSVLSPFIPCFFV